MPRNALATLLLVGFAACSDDAVDQPVQPQIDVLPSATAISVNTGASGTVTIAVKRDGGFTGDVTLSIETIPTGVSARFDPATLPNGTTTSVLTLTIVAAMPEGTAPVTLRARGAGVTDKTATIQLTVTRPTPSTGAITWKFCNPVNQPIWLAVQDGTGSWKQVTGASNTYHFDVTQPKGAVAWTRNLVQDNYVTEVFYGTPDEIASFGTLDCLGQPATTKTLTGTVTGFTPGTGASGDEVRIGTPGAIAFPTGTTFRLDGVPDGPRDFIATRVSHTFANGVFADTLTKLIVRRDIDATGSLAPFDFNGPEAVAPTVADLTLNGTNGERTMLSMSYMTDPAAPPSRAVALYATDLGTTTAAPLYTVPFTRQRDGDLHDLTLVTAEASAGPNISTRRFTKFFSAPENQTLTLGPPL